MRQSAQRIRSVILVILLGCAGAGSHQASLPATASIGTVTREWRLPPARGGTDQVRYLSQRNTDSARVEQGPGVMGDQDMSNGLRLLVMGAEAWKWMDSLMVTPESFAPTWEHLTVGPRNIMLEYRGRVVRRTVQVADSAPVTTEVEFPEPVFAFNQVDMIIRSLPKQVGYTVVLPLYSEIDAAVEHDTLTVESGPQAADSPGLWRFRFADPVIVAYYMVDPRTHAVVSYESRSRSSGFRLWRLPPVR